MKLNLIKQIKLPLKPISSSVNGTHNINYNKNRSKNKNVK